MSKLECICGATIRDQTGSEKNVADILPQSSRDEFFDACGKVLAKYLEAKENGNQDSFEYREYFRSSNVADNIGDVIHSISLDFFKSIMECEHCGRLYVQKNASSPTHFGYKPESEVCNGVLSRSVKS